MRAAVPRGSRASADGARPSARANIRRTTAPARLSQTVPHGASRNSSFQAGKPGLLREEDGIPPCKTRRRERTLGRPHPNPPSIVQIALSRIALCPKPTGDIALCEIALAGRMAGPRKLLVTQLV